MNNSCITGLSPSGHCGGAACCSTPYKCCAACPEDCNSRCGWLEDAESAPCAASADTGVPAETEVHGEGMPSPYMGAVRVGGAYLTPHQSAAPTASPRGEAFGVPAGGEGMPSPYSISTGASGRATEGRPYMGAVQDGNAREGD